MYHLLGQQNNPLDPKVSKAMEIIAYTESYFGVRPQLNTVLSVMDKEEAGFDWIPPQASNVRIDGTVYALRPNVCGSDFSPEGIATRRLNPQCAVGNIRHQVKEGF